MRLYLLSIPLTMLILTLQLNASAIIEARGMAHLLVAAAIVFFIYLITKELLWAIGLAILISIVKESNDSIFSMLDLWLDLMGVVIAAIIIEITRNRRF